MTFRHISGFTMIELVMTIVLIGIISAVLAPVIQNSVTIYASERSRAALVQKGRLALERITREVREAVPNSLSEITDAGGNTIGIEFMQARSGGRYIDSIDNFGATAFIDPLKRFNSGTPMTQLYSLGTGQVAMANDLLIIANTSPAALNAGTTVVPLDSVTPTVPVTDGATTIGEILNFASPPALPYAFSGGSSGRHYYIANTTHEVGLDTGALYWHTSPGMTDYNLAGDWSAADPMLVNGVSGLVINYDPGAGIGVAILRMNLTLTDGTESINLYQETQIRNAM